MSYNVSSIILKYGLVLWCENKTKEIPQIQKFVINILEIES